MRRDYLSLAMAFLLPVILLLIYAYAITFDVDNIRTVVYDRDKSSISRELIAEFVDRVLHHCRLTRLLRRDRPLSRFGQSQGGHHHSLATFAKNIRTGQAGRQWRSSSTGANRIRRPSPRGTSRASRRGSPGGSGPARDQAPHRPANQGLVQPRAEIEEFPHSRTHRHHHVRHHLPSHLPHRSRGSGTGAPWSS